MRRRMEQEESDYKTKLVLDICSISNRSIRCVHTVFSNAPFVDWYYILGVSFYNYYHFPF